MVAPAHGPARHRAGLGLRRVYLEREGGQLPPAGEYPRWEGGFHPDSVYAAVRLNLQTDDSEIYLSRSGTLVLTEAIAGEEVAGRFRFTARVSGTDSTIDVDGVFRGGPP